KFEDNPSGANRELLFKAQADLNLQLSREEEFWSQKAGLDWFKDGERNTKFFFFFILSNVNSISKLSIFCK
ncbi:MAG: hypothetical protein Q8842_03440, partial [Candidatus Phytoplasma australasiaticum]|nr:hypothetical protein [Candidatus Phytoplasma australasiaticum]